MKKSKLCFIIASVFLLMSVMSTAVMAKDLTLSSWLPPKHHVVTGMIQPWIDNVKEATDGRVSIKILPKKLGAVPAHFDLAKNGIADVTYGCNSYTAGRFDLSQFTELPFLGNKAEPLCVAYWRTYQKYFAKADEYRGVRLLGMFVHGPASIHNSKKRIDSVADLKGMKFRVPGGIAAELSKMMGIVGLQKPASKSYEILSRGVADGILFPKSSIKAFNLIKLVPYTTIVPDGLYNFSFFLVMNKDKFKSFSAKDQKAVLRESGEKFAKIAGKTWDKMDKVGLDAIKAAGNDVITASPEFIAQIKPLAAKVEADWIKKANAKGIDGAEALRYFREQVKNY